MPIYGIKTDPMDRNRSAARIFYGLAADFPTAQKAAKARMKHWLAVNLGSGNQGVSVPCP
jgi:hypothetical protein